MADRVQATVPFGDYFALLGCCARLVGLADAVLGTHQAGRTLSPEGLARAMACRNQLLADLSQCMGLDFEALDIQLKASYVKAALEGSEEVQDGT